MENNIFNQSEYTYLSDICSTHLITLLLGVKGSGKSTLMLSLIKFMVMNKPNVPYDIFCLVIPNYKTDQHLSSEYDFLKGRQDVYIYNEYNTFVLNHVESLHNEGYKIFFCVDDATASMQQALSDKKKSSFLTKIYTESRHVKISLILAAHTLASTFSPTMRTLCDHIFVFRISNSKLLEYVYYEFVSLNERYVDNRKKFFSDYSSLMKTEYNCLYINNRKRTIHTDVKDWSVLQLLKYKV